MNSHKGVFLTLEGIDGTGKTTQFNAITEYLTHHNYPFLACREPGGTSFGEMARNVLFGNSTREENEQVRERLQSLVPILENAAVPQEICEGLSLAPFGKPLSPWNEALVFIAARKALVEEKILPALREGRVVIADRFVDSTIAYQGAGRGLGEDNIRVLHKLLCQDLWPDKTFLFEASMAIALSRRGETARDRMEKETESLLPLISKAFEKIANMSPSRVTRIAAGSSINEVSQILLEEVSHTLKGIGFSVRPPSLEP